MGERSATRRHSGEARPDGRNQLTLFRRPDYCGFRGYLRRPEYSRDTSLYSRVRGSGHTEGCFESVRRLVDEFEANPSLLLVNLSLPPVAVYGDIRNWCSGNTSASKPDDGRSIRPFRACSTQHFDKGDSVLSCLHRSLRSCSARVCRQRNCM